MNIDVREYLRVNPISSYPLTLSDDVNDCFLLFSDDKSFQANTQNQIFKFIRNEIFQNLITVKQGDEYTHILNYDTSLNKWNANVHLTNTQFTAYARRHNCSCPTDNFPENENQPSQYYEWFKEWVDSTLTSMEQQIQFKIQSLNDNARLYYAGAVELCTGIPQNDDNLYQELLPRNAEGQIWFKENGVNISGSDRATISSTPSHGHATSRAEAMTTSFTSNKGGGKILGKFNIGNKQMVSYDQFAIASGKNMSMRSTSISSGELTYPLTGQNVLDWRNSDRTHNNIPPSFNIYIRYSDTLQGVPGQQSASTPRETIGNTLSVVEPQYESNSVPELEEFTQDYLTNHDFLLRIAQNDNMDISLMKQSIISLLEIFSNGCSHMLKVGSTPMADILRKKLDDELVRKSEFAGWMNDTLDRISKISKNITLVQEMNKSIKPRTYIGRIIMSTTDDTEDKVIANYGGSRWRRIVNFLRGVSPSNQTQEKLVDNPNEKLGKKLGEEFVCLRESNVPIHTHNVVLEDVSEPKPDDQQELGNQKWICSNRGGRETRVLMSSGSSIGVDNIELEYQISPLEYDNNQKLTIPHNNLPPYREVYMWECTELEDMYAIRYLMHGHGQNNSRNKRTYQLSDLPYTPYPATATSSDIGYQFNGWTPESIPTNNKGMFTFNATWRAIEYSINIDWNGHQPSVPQTIKSTYTILDNDYILPINIGYSTDGYRFQSWDNNGRIPRQSTGDKTFTASWQFIERTITWNLNTYGLDGDFSTVTTIQPTILTESNTTFTLPQINCQVIGYTFAGWYTMAEGGDAVTTSTPILGDTVFYAHWIQSNCVVTFNPSDGEIPENDIPIEPLKFIAIQNNSKVSLGHVNGYYKYSINGGAWQIYTLNKQITLNNIGDYVCFTAKDNNSTISSSDQIGRFTIDGKVAAYGNIMSLFRADCKINAVPEYGLANLFFGCEGLIIPPKLPAKILSRYCYSNMFKRCKGLLFTPPQIETTVEGVYQGWTSNDIYGET